MPTDSASSKPAQTAEPKPAALANTVVLVGTPATLAALASQIAAETVPMPVGAVVVGGASDREASSRATLSTASGLALPVFGSLDDLARLPARPRVAIVSLPASKPMLIARTRATLAAMGIEERFVPPLTDAMAPAPDTRSWWKPQPAAIDPAVLIGREPHALDRAAVGRVLRGKRVLITGAGGSIGSELARIAADFAPEMLILMERSENALFEIDRQLARTGVARRAVLHDVVDAAGTRRLLAELRPDVVFHAAAHKHVPLMEDHPAHAVTNNVFGTKSVADAAAAAGCGHFVLISTDKAVNPTSVMGATKRVAEQYVRDLHARLGAAPRGGDAGGSGTLFSVVRFGNVLGSACSVLPIWAAQLAEGSPITITDRRMTRFFMTIPEAATLVVQAAALSSGRGIRADTRNDRPDDAPLYVLDMGEPIRIVDLAERLIRLQGLEPVFASDGERSPVGARQAEVVFTGIRPGEKLHEELTYAAEPLRPTPHPGIRAFDAVGDPLPDVLAIVGALETARADPDPAAVLEALQRAVPEMGAPSLRRAG
ncbi:MAG: polysaccharide biosynthesis protein [Planctomycetota bacterium]|nr:polysaccharide biosynthesis protein [Planctomycetota bacterium]